MRQGQQFFSVFWGENLLEKITFSKKKEWLQSGMKTFFLLRKSYLPDNGPNIVCYAQYQPGPGSQMLHISDAPQFSGIYIVSKTPHFQTFHFSETAIYFCSGTPSGH